MKPLTEPSAYRETMSPMCRKLDISFMVALESAQRLFFPTSPPRARMHHGASGARGRARGLSQPGSHPLPLSRSVRAAEGSGTLSLNFYMCRAGLEPREPGTAGGGGGGEREEEAQEKHGMRSARLSVPPSPHSFLPAANREQSGSPARKSMQIFLAWEENRSGTAKGGGGYPK